MRMFIDASIHGERNPELEKLAAFKAIEFLSQVAAERHKLNLPATKIEQEPDSSVVREMWKACRMIISTDLTPMAAVAGSIADAVADYLISEGATRSIVNNGGDIALRTIEDAPITVGIRSDISSHIVDHKLRVLGSDRVGGVCSSGLGGRSFTRGIASSAVVFAARCSVADAAATEIANHTYIQSSGIRRIQAKELDPDSDIKDLEITIGFDKLTEREINEALDKGLARAEQLTGQGLILGAFLNVCGRMATCGSIFSRLEHVRLKS